MIRHAVAFLSFVLIAGCGVFLETRRSPTSDRH